MRGSSTNSAGPGRCWSWCPGPAGKPTATAAWPTSCRRAIRWLTYDRRGSPAASSSAPRTTTSGWPPTPATSESDVRRLIKHLGGEPAIVVGNSSGALVALDVLIRHPDVVHTVVAHEPTAVALLPDGEAWVAFFEAVYDTYRRSGIHPA